MIVPDQSALGLVAKGLLRQDDGGACCITAAGLRVLADEMEAGRVADALQRMAANTAQRQDHR